MAHLSVSDYWTIERRYCRALRCWSNAIKRCYHVDDYSHSLYGRRGIAVCDRWLDPVNGAMNFLQDMGLPEAHESLDRIDSNGNYEPSNCRWIRRREQTRNMRSNWIVTYHGVEWKFIELCEIKNLHPMSVRTRIKKLGWTVEDAFDRPGITKTFEDYRAYCESYLRSPEYRERNRQNYQNRKARLQQQQQAG